MNWAFSIFFGGSFLQLFSWNNRWWTAGRFLAHLFFTRALGLQNDRSPLQHERSVCKVLPLVVLMKAKGWMLLLGSMQFRFRAKESKGFGQKQYVWSEIYSSGPWAWFLTAHRLGSNWARSEECNSQPCHSDSLQSFPSTSAVRSQTIQMSHSTTAEASLSASSPGSRTIKKKTTILVIEHQYMLKKKNNGVRWKTAATPSRLRRSTPGR